MSSLEILRSAGVLGNESMGVTYKLKDEVVRFIISQRQGDSLSSCRQLAESVSQKFGLRLSKSSVHDVLKETGIITPRGRKPKTKFEIPQEKKKQIQTSLSQIKLLASPVELKEIPAIPADHSVIRTDQTVIPDRSVIPDHSVILSAAKDLKPSDNVKKEDANEKKDEAISPEYEGAGRIFLKAALWDLGIFTGQDQISFPTMQETDWDYFLTYCKGIKVELENNKVFFIDLPLPIERCIRETAAGLINNIRPLIVHKVSDEVLFKACMDDQIGHKIKNVSIVDRNNHILLEFSNIVEVVRIYLFKDVVFVDSDERNLLERARMLFFSQTTDNNSFMEKILNLTGYANTNKFENTVTLLIDEGYDSENMLKEAAERLNGMCLRDEQDRLVRVKIQKC